MQDRILDKILKELMLDPKAEARSAACVWLVALCTFVGRPPRLLRRLPKFQEAFSSLLGDSSELAQARPPMIQAAVRAVALRGHFVCGMLNGSRVLSACPMFESRVARPLQKVGQQG